MAPPILVVLGGCLFSPFVYYLTSAGCSVLQDSPRFQKLYRTFSILFFLCFFAANLTPDFLPLPLAKFLCWIASPWFLYAINLLFSFLLVKFACFVNSYVKFLPIDLHRFRKRCFILTHVFIFLEYVIGNINYHYPRIVHYELEASHLPQQHRELQILLVSDLHLGYIIDKMKFKKWVQLMNSQNADIILFAGDISDNMFKAISRQNMFEEFSLLTAKYGVFAVRGNHDYIAGKPTDLENYLKAITQIRYLRDSWELINNSFYVVGRDENMNRTRLPIDHLIAPLDQNKPIILIDHQPPGSKVVAENGITLAVSGHTHGGQFFPVTFIAKLLFELPHGYMKKGNAHIVVTSGLGLWGPQCRFGSNSEIVNIKLRY